MRRWTTTAQTITINGVDLRGCDIYVTYKQGSFVGTDAVTVKNPSSERTETQTILFVALSQLQSGGLTAGECELQVNWVTQGGQRHATEIKTVNIGDNLLEEVLTYG